MAAVSKSNILEDVVADPTWLVNKSNILEDIVADPNGYSQQEQHP